MAEIGGYQCEFVDQVPEELVCNECKLVAKKLYTTDCCGKHFCQACIDPVLKDKKPCPSCGETEFSTFLIKGALKRVSTLQVHCTMKQRGCKWVGQLEQLDIHLDTDCQYADVECPSKCDQKVQKQNLASHLKDDCPKRDYMCPHCTYKANFETISLVHWPECPYFPLKCPNLCGVTCEREIMEDHMQICSLVQVECEFGYAGCKEKFLRQDQDNHMERHAMKHLSLMAAAALRTNKEFEQKLKEKDKQIQELQEQVNAKDVEMKQELIKLREELKERDQREKEKLQMELYIQGRDKKLTAEIDKKLTAEIVTLKKQTDDKFDEATKQIHIAAGVPHYLMVVCNFAKLKRDKSNVPSEAFYTHPRGYKFFIVVAPNGLRMGEDTHVSVWLSFQTGEFDTTLPWPAKATFTLQLLNQHCDRNHVTVTKTLEWEKPTIHKAGAQYIDDTFVPHTRLSVPYLSGRYCRTPDPLYPLYLNNNCLRFRMTKITIHNDQED